MNKKFLVDKFKGSLVDTEGLSHYWRWSLSHFRDPEKCEDPIISMTINLDITELVKYREGKGKVSAYLIWKMCHALNQVWEFGLRDLSGEWFHFDDPACFIPIATGDERRFGRIYIESPVSLGEEGFIQEYENQKLAILSGKQNAVTVSNDIFSLCVLIGNLPQFELTGFKFHQFPSPTGRPAMYWGKRFVRDGRMFTSFHISMDHANSDPELFSQVLEIFKKNTKKLK